MTGTKNVLIVRFAVLIRQKTRVTVKKFQFRFTRRRSEVSLTIFRVRSRKFGRTGLAFSGDRRPIAVPVNSVFPVLHTRTWSSARGTLLRATFRLRVMKIASTLIVGVMKLRVIRTQKFRVIIGCRAQTVPLTRLRPC